MEEDLINLKTKIANEFWKVKFTEIGQLVEPRKKKKALKVLSLTNSRNTEEVKILTCEHISSKSNLFAWCNDSIESLSLASESKYNDIIDDTKFEETLLNCPTHKIDGCFPFHIFNMDFTSQSPESANGRMEKELHSIEKVIEKQKSVNSPSSWLMLFTTLIDNKPIDADEIVRNSDTFSRGGWDGLALSKTGSVNVRAEIKAILLEFFEKIKDKYGLNVTIDSFTKPIDINEVFSISIMVKN